MSYFFPRGPKSKELTTNEITGGGVGFGVSSSAPLRNNDKPPFHFFLFFEEADPLALLSPFGVAISLGIISEEISSDFSLLLFISFSGYTVK